KLAESEKPGACHVEVPEDVTGEAVEGTPLSTERARRPSPDRPALQAAVRLIEEASHPLIFAGNGVIRGHASRELRELARTHGIRGGQLLPTRGRGGGRRAGGARAAERHGEG